MGIWQVTGIITISFVAMEFVAWATHKFVMHGFLWQLHRDHHQRDHDHVLERNDSFFLIFALPSIFLFLIGTIRGLGTPWLWIGLGILLYGIAYFLVHEVFIHQRIKLHIAGLHSPMRRLHIQPFVSVSYTHPTLPTSDLV